MIRIVKLKGGVMLYATFLHESGPFNLAPATPTSEGGVAGRDSYTKREEEEGSDKSKLLHLYLNSSLGKFLFTILFIILINVLLLLMSILYIFSD